VEIDGVHIPGTLAGDRSVKLDDVPADLLGAIEVSKTLSADQDADAIGGTVNLLSKIPEGAPRGYVEGRYSYQTLENNSQGFGSMTYGGRVGENGKFGYLIGASYDRTNRVIEDVEPSWQANLYQNGAPVSDVTGGGFNHVFPNDWSEREYNYYRTRYGFNTDVDYRFSPTSNVYFRGLYSAFFDQANRWVTDVRGDGSSGPAGDGDFGGDSAGSGKTRFTESNRGPVEHTWGFIGGGRHRAGTLQLDWAGNFSGSTATTHQHYDQSWNGPTVGNYNYGPSTNLVPQYSPSAATRAAMTNPADYTFRSIGVSNEGTDGQNFGGQANALVPFALGDLPASFKIGVKYTNEHKSDTPNNGTITYTGAGPTPTMTGLLGNYNVSNFYGHFCAGCYQLGPFTSMPAVQAMVRNNPNFTYAPDDYGNLSSNFSGTEQIVAAYGMATVDVGDLHINAGLRAENTNIGYRAYADNNGPNTGTVAGLSLVRLNHAYTDIFPSAQLRFAIDENTNIRAAFTRGIARPDYASLAPTFNANGILPGYGTPISAGNPSLKPEHSWNTDLLFEHYFPSVGVITGGAFYKDISDFVFNREVIYTGQIVKVQTYLPSDTATFYITQPQNGPHAWLYGFEADYNQHFTFLPGALAGIGFDANWTWVNSRATVPQDTTVYHGNPFRHAPIQRQFPNLFNIALLYDYSTVTARIAGQYTAASIYGYGSDGSSNPGTGDNWNFPHWQIDASLVWTAFGRTALTLQALNINNEYFGFFNGLSSTANHWNTQREYYGTTVYIGMRQGF
jgi:TonB-dependent receptor